MRLTPALVLGAVVGFSVAVASCGAPPKMCGPSNCTGCCDETGECLGGTAVFECGTGGAVCQTCAGNEVCAAGACGRFDGGDYDANFPGPRDASVNFDAGLFDAGPMPVDAGVDAGMMVDAGRPDAGMMVDAGRPDAGAMDAGVDAGMMVDAGRPDAGQPMDAGVDAGVMMPDAGPPLSFMNDISPIFGANCTSCHPNRASYADVRARVVPGNPNSSVIYQRITGLAGNPMPPGAQLSNSDPAGTQLIERWILQGAPNN
jgi:hypothetical protein